MERSTEKITDDILLIRARDRNGVFITTIFYKYIPVVKFNGNSIAERRIAAVELVEQDICNQTTAGSICNFHRNSVSKFISIKAHFGIKALLTDNRGLKKPLKYNEDIRQTIQFILYTHPDWKDYQVANQAAIELNTDISRSAVARIRRSFASNDNDDQLFTIETMHDLIDIAKRLDEQNNGSEQLELNFEADVEFKQKKNEFLKNASPRSRVKSEQDLIRRLQLGERSPFAGSFMHYLFLQEINFSDLVSCIPDTASNTYQHDDILRTLFFKIANDIKSIEALKLINSSSLGALIGKSRSPEKDVLRDQLNVLAKKQLSDVLIDKFARVLLEQQRIDPEVFFIDGHFLPYYGLHVLAKGYYTVRRLAMKGNELYAISDLQGRPLFFITESNDIDFRPIISRAADKLIELGTRRPILTFDRGGYGIQFFSELSVKADFVTWAKYITDKQLSAINDDQFTQCIAFGKKQYLISEQQRIASESLQTAKKEGRTKPIQLELRLLVLQDINTTKRIGIYTNNTVKSAGDIAYYMLSRWGDSENLYKELMAKFNINYHPGYDIEELQDQPLVDNPGLKLMKDAIKILTNEIEKLTEQKQDIAKRLQKRKDKRLDARLLTMNSQLEEKNRDKSNFEQKLPTVPEKISIVELLQGKKMSRCDLEKKKLYDFMQFMVLHSYERLKDIFKEHYTDKRDIKQVLRMITKKSGFIKLIGNTLVVLLDRIELKKHRAPAEALCRELNQRNIVMNGPIKLKLFFYVSKF
jgi:transposase